MLTVLNVKSAVIMLGIVSAVFPGSAIVSGQLHSFLLLFSFLSVGRAALLPNLPVFASDNTQYEVTQASLLWAMAAALDLHREVALPVPLHKGLVPSVLPPHQLTLMRFLQKFSPKIFAKNQPTSDTTFHKSFDCRLSYLPLRAVMVLLIMCAKSCDIFTLPQLGKFFLPVSISVI